MTVPAPRRGETNWLMGSRSYTLLLGTRFLVTVAVQMQAVSVGWLAYDLSRDPLALGLVGLAEAVPALGLALFAGLVVDRRDPLWVYRRALLGSLASAGLLWTASARAAAGAGGAVLPVIYAASVVTGAARAFIMPANFTMLPRLVSRERMGTATAWSSAVMQTAFLSGPPLGGALLAVLGAPRTFVVVLSLLAAALTASGGIALGPDARRAPRPVERPLEGLLSGARFVLGHQVILGAMALDMFGVLFGGVTAVLPIFARDVFARGPAVLGLMRGAVPLGSVVMGLILVRRPVTRFRGSALLGAVLGFGACMIGFGLARSLPLALVLLAGAGMCDSLSMVMRQTILQLSTPDEVRGRVAAVNSMFIGSSNEIGAFESGVAAKLLGLRPSVVFGGLMTLAVVAVTAWRAPRLRRLELSRLAGVR